MSIFGIIGISFVIAAIVSLSAILLLDCFVNDPTRILLCALAICVMVTVVGTFAGVGISTEEAIEYRANFDAQKDIIEQSLELDELSGLERIDLVTKAAELNGEMAAKMVSAER